MGPVLTVKSCVNNNASLSRPFQEISLRDRFRGALMGLALVPIALQINADTYRQRQFTQLMQTAAPGLLLYHGRWRWRQQWLKQVALAGISAESQLSEFQLAERKRIAQDVIYPQLLLAGDCLEGIIAGRTPWVMNELQANEVISAGLARYDFSAEQKQYYQRAYLALQKATQPESYALSIQLMAQSSGYISCFMQSEFTESESGRIQSTPLQAMPLMLLIMGFVSGARVGMVPLPIHWQVGLHDIRKSTLTLANQLYRQWAGSLS